MQNAFNGCAITDVYYEGTEEQWNAISIASGNTPLIEVTIHFSSYGPSVVEHTVVFKDYDDTVLSTQMVEDGS